MRSGTRTPSPVPLFMVGSPAAAVGAGQGDARRSGCGVGRAEHAGPEAAGGLRVRVPPASPAAAGLLVVGDREHVGPHSRNLLGSRVRGVGRQGKPFGQGRKSFALGNPGGGTWPEEVGGGPRGQRGKVGEMHPSFGGNLRRAATLGMWRGRTFDVTFLPIP